MAVLVLGSCGQLAQHLGSVLDDAIFLGRAELDLTSTAKIAPRIIDAAPSIIVNAAAYTAVDAAEDDADPAHRVNAEAVAAIAAAAAALGVPLLQVSTDYVFDGLLDRPYREHDAPNPLNVYGATKLAGERAVQTRCERYWILRASWVFSEYGSNFVKTMLRLGAERDEVRVVDDQRGRPTYAGDLAALIARLVRMPGPSLPWGLYHVAGGRTVSWADFAEAIFDRALSAGVIGRRPRVTRVSTTEFPTRAARPGNTVLDGTLLERHLGTGGCDWESGLDAMIGAITGRTPATTEDSKTTGARR